MDCNLNKITKNLKKKIIKQIYKFYEAYNLFWSQQVFHVLDIFLEKQIYSYITFICWKMV